jgi:hypothetical protein
MDESNWIGARSPEFRAIFERIKVATRLSSELSRYCMDETEPIREAFEELIGKPVGDRFTLILWAINGTRDRRSLKFAVD